MNKRQVVVLWIIAILLIVAAVLVRLRDRDGSTAKMQRADGETFLKEFPAEQVAKIEVKGAKSSTTLVRKDGKWTVANRGNYPATQLAVNEFLRTLTEVKVTQGIECEPSFLPRFGMDASASKEEDRGIETVFSNDAGSEIAKVNFGKNLQAAGDPMSMMGGGGTSGRFVHNAADTSGVYKVSEVFPTLASEPKGWLDPQFIQVEKIKSISVSPPAKPEEVAWKIVRADENAEFTLEGAKEGETADAAVTAPLKSLFSYARFDDVADAEEVAETVNAVEKRTVKIETFEGFHYTLTLAPTLPKEDAPATPDAPPAGEMFLMTVDVSAELPAERKKEEKETPEDAKAKDTAFTERKATLEKRLAAEKALAGRFFKVAVATVEPILKERDGLLKKAGEPAAAVGPGGAMPPGGPTLVPQQPRRPVEAVTPPIAIPPLEEGEGE